MTTRTVEKAKWRIFLVKAEDYLAMARQGIEAGRWDPSVSAAIHAGILACDVATVGSIGKRNTGQHDDIDGLLAQAAAALSVRMDDSARRISRLLSVKNVAEYEARRMTRQDAEAALKAATRLVQWAVELSKRFA